MAQVDDIGNACCEVISERCCPRLSAALQIFCSCVVVPAIIVTVVLLVLYVNPKNPEFSVEDFYVSAFNKTSNNASTNTISFNIKLRNQNAGIGLYYDGPVDVTFSYIPTRQTNNTTIWKYSVPKFYQGNAQSRRLIDVIAPLESPDMPVFNQTAVIEHSTFLPSDAISTGLEPLVYFKVDFVTKVRFKLISKPHAKDFTLSAEVPIGANTGQKFAKRGIQASAAPGNGWCGTQTAVMVVLTTISLIFM